MLTSLLLFCLAGDPTQAPAPQASHWFKGNTHAHTALCGHADSPPSTVARWYLEHGYQFLVLSEHNRFIDPATVELPEPRRADFILVPGEEVTGARNVHLTALGVPDLVPWEYDDEAIGKIIQHHVDEILRHGGEPILNHPNYKDTVAARDLEPVARLHFFELFNGHPSTQSFGSAKLPSTEALWDVLLTGGRVIYAISSDDAHTFAEWGEGESNPGRGWCMVRAEALTSDAIVAAMRRGDFYATSGVILSAVEVTEKSYRLQVDEAATERELQSSVIHGHKVASGEPGFAIELVGPGGNVVGVYQGTAASHGRHAGEAYVRARVTFTCRRGDGLERFYAWTQPAFGDDRLSRASAADEAWRKGAR